MSSNSSRASKQRGEETLSKGVRLEWLGGAIAAGVAIIGQILVGAVYNGFEAHDLIQAFIPSARSLGGAVVQASATVLALMLTMLILTRKEIGQLEYGLFHRIRHIALLSSIGLASAILLLLFLSIPLQQSKSLPVNWFQIIYYALIVVTAAIAGLVVAIVIMLYDAIESIIQVVRPAPGKKLEKDTDA